jgi:hypothetical protein
LLAHLTALIIDDNAANRLPKRRSVGANKVLDSKAYKVAKDRTD